MEIVIGFIVVFCAGLVQGLTGFGLAMVAVPFFVTIFPLKETVPIIIALSVCMAVFMLCNCVKYARIKKIWTLILASAIFAPIGAYLLLFINPNYLKLSFGIVIIAFSILLICNKSFPIKNEKLGYAVAGSLGGLLNGSISLGGPPVVLFLSNQGVDKDIFRANITVYFTVLNIVTLGTLLVNGIMNTMVIERALRFLPGMLIGLFTGMKLSTKLDERIFKRITLIILIISGVWMIINTLGSGLR